MNVVNPRALNARLYGMAYYGYYIGVEATYYDMSPGAPASAAGQYLYSMLQPAMCRHASGFAGAPLTLYFNTQHHEANAHDLLHSILPNLTNITPTATLTAIVRDNQGGGTMTKPMPMSVAGARCVVNTSAEEWLQEIQDATTHAINESTEADMGNITSVIVVVTGLPQREWFLPPHGFVPMAVPISTQRMPRRRVAGCPDFVIPDDLRTKTQALCFSGLSDNDSLCGVRSLVLLWCQYLTRDGKGRTLYLRKWNKPIGKKPAVQKKMAMITDAHYQFIKKEKVGKVGRGNLSHDIIESSGYNSASGLQAAGGCTWTDLQYFLGVVCLREGRDIRLRIMQRVCGAFTLTTELTPLYVSAGGEVTREVALEEAELGIDKGPPVYFYMLYLPNGCNGVGHYVPITNLNALAGHNREYCEVCVTTYVKTIYTVGEKHTKTQCPSCFSIKCKLCNSTEVDHDYKCNRDHANRLKSDALQEVNKGKRAKCVDDSKVCEDCMVEFHDIECFHAHKANDVCSKVHRCLECNVRIRVTMPNEKNGYQVPTFEHECGVYKCPGCKVMVQPPHYCDIRPLNKAKQERSKVTAGVANLEEALLVLREFKQKNDALKKSGEKVVLDEDGRRANRELKYLSKVTLFSDFESVQDNDEQLHEVNLVCTQDEKGERLPVFSLVDDWLEYIFDKYPRGGDIIFHNGSGYDFQFIIPRLKYMGCAVEQMIMTGSRIKFFRASAPGKKTNKLSGGWRFVDSLCFLTMPLSKFPETFGLTTGKGFFPHLSNTNNPDPLERGVLPPLSMFLPETMNEKKKAELVEWHAERATQGPWYLEVERELYCQQDVTVLREGCLAFQGIIEEATRTDTHWGVLPFDDITIPSTAYRVWGSYYNNREQREDTEDDSPTVPWLPRLPTVIHEELLAAGVGGRTEAFKFLWRWKKGHPYAQYVDFTSLYPWVNKNCRYPVGHPLIITKQKLKADADVGELTLSDIPAMFLRKDGGGYVDHEDIPLMVCKVDVQCPKNLHIPLLHEKIKGEDKLMFTLRDKTDAVYTSVELLKALKLGYEVTTWTKVWYFPSAEEGLFKEYINKFLKMKQQAAGWGTLKTEAQKDAYIAAYLAHECVKLDKLKIGEARNAGIYQVAKLFLNSIWGKFGQKLLAEFKVKRVLDATDAVDLSIWRQLNEGIGVLPTLDAEPGAGQDFTQPLPPGVVYYKEADVILDERFIIVTYSINRSKAHESMPDSDTARSADPYMDRLHCRNLTAGQCAQVSVFTTAYARLKLYELLEKLGDRVIYCDTDSCIFVPRKGEDPNDLAPLGQYLGDLTNELQPKDQYTYNLENGITFFCSAGPKHYGYRLADGTEKYKVKGLRTGQEGVKAQLCLNDMYRAVVFGRDDLEIHSETLQVKNFQIRTVRETKIYRATMTKREAILPAGVAPEDLTEIATRPWDDVTGARPASRAQWEEQKANNTRSALTLKMDHLKDRSKFLRKEQYKRGLDEAGVKRKREAGVEAAAERKKQRERGGPFPSCKRVCIEIE